MSIGFGSSRAHEIFTLRLILGQLKHMIFLSFLSRISVIFVLHLKHDAYIYNRKLS